ncbi:NuoM family protein [Bacillus sp. V5-8f]|uniref:complex I subunit 4 family protein n=1 Tax=Bacillus sp. V5-8f TaxID=2053044 RepID=UPI000C76E7E7|nr:NADH-quinone oxidoreductase subunit M [Bacillus sp. V5-8f]PLT35853.1 NADH-quinone oxidoreductase subunit M [Bacillus sp. V5-8f]
MNSMILTLLVFSPVLGILLMVLVPKTDERNLKVLGFLGTIPALLISLYLYVQYATGADLSRFSVKIDWFRFGNFEKYDPNLLAVDYELSVDGLSLIMVILTAVLSTMASIASIHIKKEWKGYFMLFLLLEIGMLGVFTAQNLILFFIFFEITLIPMFFLIGKWGFLEKEKAAYSFLLFNGVGSAILLIVIMVLFARTGTSNIDALRHIMTVGGVSLFAPVSDAMKYTLLFGLLVAFGIKLPIFPLHTWMLRVHVQAPPSIVMLHAGVLLKIGAFGLIRFGMGIFPEQFKEIAFFVAVLGVINLLYGAFLAMIQNDFKMVLAYSSISHMGIVLIGLGALNEAGMQGAIFQVVSHGLISALLFFLVGVMHERVKTSMIDQLGGMAHYMPITSGFLLAGAMASLGLPGMSGFISEFMAFLGLFKEEPILASIGALGIILTAVYLLRAVLGMTFGKAKSTVTEGVSELKGIEFAPVLILLALIITIGIYPTVLSGPLKGTLDAIMLGIGG